MNIDKGLEQSIEAARKVGEKLYILKTLSDTRFSAYFEKSMDIFEKRIETTITALKKRAESNNKEVREKASIRLKKVCNKQFLLLNLGLLDIYRLLGSISCQLQKVEQFPWDIPKTQTKLLETLKNMEKLKLIKNDENNIDNS